MSCFIFQIWSWLRCTVASNLSRAIHLPLRPFAVETCWKTIQDLAPKHLLGFSLGRNEYLILHLEPTEQTHPNSLLTLIFIWGRVSSLRSYLFPFSPHKSLVTCNLSLGSSPYVRFRRWINYIYWSFICSRFTWSKISQFLHLWIGMEKGNVIQLWLERNHNIYSLRKTFN